MNISIDLSLGRNYTTFLLKDKSAVVSVRKYDSGAYYIRYSHKLSSENYHINKVLHGNNEQILNGYDIKGIRDLSVYYWNEDYKLNEPLAICINERSDHAVSFLRKEKSNEWITVPVKISENILNGANMQINGIYVVDISGECHSGRVRLEGERRIASSNHPLYFKIYTYAFYSAPSLITYKYRPINVFPTHIANIVSLSIYSLSGKCKEDEPLLINVIQRNKRDGSTESFWFENTFQGEKNSQWRHVKDGNVLSSLDALKTKLESLKEKLKGTDV